MSADEKTPSCVATGTGATCHGKRGFDCFAGISHESAGSTGICMHLLTIPPGGRARPHLYEHHETAICVLSGEAACGTARD